MPTLTRAELSKKIVSLGLTRSYKPMNDQANNERDDGEEKILLEVRKPAKIVDGYLDGSEIDIYDNSTVRVWTSRKTKAMAVAKANGFKIRLTDGEAELFIPTGRADEFLHGFGAKVKKTSVYTPEQKAELTARLAKARQNRKVDLAVAV